MYSISGYDHLEAVEAFYEGLITVQDPSSALAAHLAGIKAGDTVLDICSAPGGKTLHAADLLKGTGRVEARDLTEYKISLVEQNLFRCGFANVETKVWDARIFDPEMEEKADVVLADLPCSGLGIIGKKPDKMCIRDRKTLPKGLGQICHILQGRGQLLVHPLDVYKRQGCYRREHVSGSRSLAAGAFHLHKGEMCIRDRVEIVDLTNNVVLTSYNVNFVETEV